jgi:hypothetical protein
MKQAILTKFLAPTNTKGKRVKAWCAAGEITIAWDHAFGPERNHEAAAYHLVAKTNWPDGWRGWKQGALPDGSGYCFVQIERKEE